MENGLFYTLAGIAFVNVLAWLSPGPNTLAIISASIGKGRRAGVMTAAGSSLGGMVWAAITIMGAATVFDLFPTGVLVFRLAGAGYLVWLGWKSLRAALSGQGAALEITPVRHSDAAAFRTGFLVIMTNPKAMLFFGSVFAALIPQSAPVGVWVVIVLFSQAQAFGQHCITVAVFSSRAVLTRVSGAQNRVNGMIGTLYSGLGLAVAWDALRRI
jgi:threonine/homoserine/homoserine lactone efflux protein